MEATISRRKIGIYDNIFDFLLSVYAILSIFEPYLNNLIGSIMKYFLIFFVLFCLGTQKIKVNSSNDSLLLLIWLFYKFFTLLWSQDYSTPQIHWLSQISMVALIVVLSMRVISIESLMKFTNVYWISSAILGFLSLFFAQSYLGITESRQVLVLFGTEIDPNNMAALLLIGFSISLYYLFVEKKHRILSSAILIINSFGVLRTASRAGFLCAIALFILILILSNRKKTILFWIRNTVLILLVLLCLYFIAIKFVNADSFKRLFTFKSYAGGSNRDILWSNAWNLYTSNLLYIVFGSGWGTATVNTGLSVAVHNTFLTMLCDVGLLGFLIFMIPVCKMLLICYQKREYLPILLFISSFISSFFIDAINKRFFWNGILFLFIFVNYIKNNARRESL